MRNWVLIKSLKEVEEQLLGPTPWNKLALTAFQFPPRLESSHYRCCRKLLLLLFTTELRYLRCCCCCCCCYRKLLSPKSHTSPLPSPHEQIRCHISFLSPHMAQFWIHFSQDPLNWITSRILTGKESGKCHILDIQFFQIRKRVSINPQLP